MKKNLFRVTHSAELNRRIDERRHVARLCLPAWFLPCSIQPFGKVWLGIAKGSEISARVREVRSFSTFIHNYRNWQCM